MEKAFYKLEVTKFKTKWFCTLYKRVQIKDIESWEPEGQVTSESFANLQYKAADEGFIDLLNQNEE